MMNPRPLGMRKTVQLLIILTLLAWATQTLFHQWGYGGLILSGQNESAMIERDPPITLELRSQIRPNGTKVTLGDVCRWSERDQIAMEPLAGLVLTRLGDAPGAPPRRISLEEVRSALRDAGVNVANLQFSGAAMCVVSPEAAIDPTDAPTTQPVAGPLPMIADAPQTPLKDLLLADLHERLGMSAQQMQIDFDAKDQQMLAMTTPRNRFDFDGAQTAAGSGKVSWTVQIKTDAGERQAMICARARSWEDQLVLTRPLSRGQAFLKSDVAPRRALVEQPTTNPLTAADQILGHIAAKKLQTGDVLCADDMQSPPIVTSGQTITVTLNLGAAGAVQTVATALDDGVNGSTVRARNEVSRQIYHVHVTAPGAGDVTDQPTDVATTTSN